jgi:hypothetical protein
MRQQSPLDASSPELDRKARCMGLELAASAYVNVTAMIFPAFATLLLASAPAEIAAAIAAEHCRRAR